MKSILTEAAEIVGGARQADYGTPLANHARTAALWSTYLGVPVTARQVCMMNILQKVSRDVFAAKTDNLVDIAGYAENAHLCAAAVDKAKAEAEAAKAEMESSEALYRKALMMPNRRLDDLMEEYRKAEFTTPLPPGVDVD